MTAEAEAKAPAGAPGDALALRDALAAGEITASALAERCLARIAAREPVIRAFAHIDPEGVRAAARALDARRADGLPLGPLHGLPVAVKDVVDTADMPTENGAAADAGRRPERDAVLVARLRAAGAVVIGKTVTTELAYLTPGPTRNPRDPEHTPGGSSSGSAAAVADAMAPLAIGTQTGGSVIRPAAFCGVVGLKPSFGAIPRTGVLSQSPSLDTMGVFAATVEGAALLADALIGPDPGDPASRALPPPALLPAARAAAPGLRLAFVRPPGWEEADPEYRTLLEGFAAELGAACREATLPPEVADAAGIRLTINQAEMAHALARYAETPLGAETAEAMAAGRRIAATDYLAARAAGAALAPALAPFFREADALLAPAAPGPAPAGLGSTGSSIFNGLWTLAGCPAITLPLLATADGLPLGVQLVGPPGGDGWLVRTAAALVRRAG